MISQSLIARITAEAEQSFSASSCPSLSIAVGYESEVIAANAWGYANTATKSPATAGTSYLLASITKPITATAVALLAADGAFSLDAAVADLLGYPLPQVVPGPGPTVRDLLTHRAGIGKYWKWLYADHGITRDFDLGEALRRHVVITTAPGRQYEYSNLGYGVLDQIIEIASGQDLATFAAARIFEPLRMTSAWIGPDYRGGAGSIAQRYGTDGSAYPVYDVEHRGATLAWATAADVATFGMAHGETGIFGAVPGVREGHQPAFPGTTVGHSWRLSSPGGELVVSHAGGMGGVSALLLVCPRRGIAVTALVNQSYTDLARRVAHATLSTVLSAVTGRSIQTMTPPSSEPKPSSVAPAQTPVGRWSGSLQTEHESLPLALELHSDGTGALSVGADSPAIEVGFLPSEGHAVRLVAAAATEAADAICLDLILDASDLRGRAAVTDLAGARLLEPTSDGGSPAARLRDYTTYPIELRRIPRA